jgi:hypothetical protein
MRRRRIRKREREK